MLRRVWIMVLLHFWVGPRLYVIINQALWEIEDLQQWLLLPSFASEQLQRAQTNQPRPITPKGKPLGFHTVGWKH